MHLWRHKATRPSFFFLLETIAAKTFFLTQIATFCPLIGTENPKMSVWSHCNPWVSFADQIAGCAPKSSNRILNR
jgi:hypothetical protein